MKALFADARGSREAEVEALDGAAPDGLLAGYPGAAMLVRRDGNVLACNADAEALAAAFDEPARAELRAQVAQVVARGVAAVASVELNGGAERQWIELTLLPREDQAALVLVREVTLDRRLRAALIESRQRYKDLVEISSDFAWETGRDGAFIFVSPRGALGYAAEDFIGRRPEYFLAEDAGDAVPLPFAAGNPVEGVRFWFRRADDTAACLVAAALPVHDAHGEWCGARGVCRDVTAESERDASLARSHHHQRTLDYIGRVVREEIVPKRMLDAAAATTARATGALGCCIYRRDAEGGLSAAARHGKVPDKRRAGALLRRLIDAGEYRGGCFEATLGDRALLACAADYRLEINGVICLWRPGSEPAPDQETRTLLTAVAGQLGIALAQIARQEELERLSTTDPLTELTNRRAFMAALDAALNRARRVGRPGALIYVDLDNFKVVNDRHGHQCGDAVLRRVADILKGTVRPYDHVARLGGDEFAVWLGDIEASVVRRRADQIVAAAGRLASEFPNPAHPLGVSIGVALVLPTEDEDVDTLIARADRAMYQAKHGGKARVTIAPPAGAGD